MIKTRLLTANAVLAALYAAVALLLPATALANFRLSTALYVLAAWNPALIPGLAVGNAFAGLPQGPIDMLMGAVAGLATTFACSKMGRWAPVAVLVIPTLLVPTWLSWMFGAPYWVVALSLLKGQALSALLALFLMRVPQLKRIVITTATGNFVGRG